MPVADARVSRVSRRAGQRRSCCSVHGDRDVRTRDLDVADPAGREVVRPVRDQRPQRAATATAAGRPAVPRSRAGAARRRPTGRSDPAAARRGRRGPGRATTQPHGLATTDGDVDLGQRRPPAAAHARTRSTDCAATSASRAAASAVSTGCARLPATTTPASAPSAARCRRPAPYRRGRTRPAGAGELVLGRPSPGEHDGVARDRAYAPVRAHDLDRLDPVRARRCAPPGCRSAAGSGSARQPRAGTRRTTGAAPSRVSIAATGTPACCSVSTAEKLTCSAPTTTARVPTGSPCS